MPSSNSTRPSDSTTPFLSRSGSSLHNALFDHYLFFDVSRGMMPTSHSTRPSNNTTPF